MQKNPIATTLIKAEASGSNQTENLSGYEGCMAVIRVILDNNNYYTLTACDVIGQNYFVSAKGYGGNSPIFTDLDFVVAYASGKYNLVIARSGGVDVTNNSKLTVNVLGI